MAAEEKPAAAGDGARAGIGSAVRRIGPKPNPSPIDRQGRVRSALEMWQIAAYHALPERYRAAVLIGLLPVSVDRTNLETKAGNAWFSEQSGLSDRAITYGIAELVKAGLVCSEISGPKRTITLLIPTAGGHPHASRQW